MTLSQSTLASAPVGASVLIDDGTGKWRPGTVANDGSGALTPNGAIVPSTAPAAVPATANGQVVAPAGTALTLLGAASDGSLWFTYAGVGGLTRTLVCGAVTTVGSVSGYVAAQIGSAWTMVYV